MESSNGSLHEELLNQPPLSDLRDASVAVWAWRSDYDTCLSRSAVRNAPMAYLPARIALDEKSAQGRPSHPPDAAQTRSSNANAALGGGICACSLL
ncbi:hypothetical protein DR046_13795 [Jannaschia formosa]|nr:hypothetical protein DR046_13795 [Jannaschia formosa]